MADLSGCGLYELPKLMIQKDFSFVKDLDLGFNQFYAFPFSTETLSSVPRLEVLNLAGNKISSLPSFFFTALKNLKELILNGNQVQRIPHEIGNMPSLRKISLSNNRVNKIPFEIGRLDKLEELQLDGNPISSIPPEFGHCKNSFAH
eukprot:TRINITY_DN11711_c0_g1_i1.p1 TRINITY_DN11711_c0_g1~~TRINITY_DN11711_c0_g1_i1.p1  ORF type:complete len:159 (-),score=34.28 TRINITY_DN11711_c0_g1_i1:157-597(-)